MNARRILFNYEWLTFAPNPRASHGGYDASRKAWKLHATIPDLHKSAGIELAITEWKNI